MADEVSQEIYESFRHLKLKNYEAAESVLQQGLKKAEEKGDTTQAALFYSSLGVVAKARGQDKDAWRFYEKAEKILPADPALKMIVAKFLIDRFGQHDTAIKKLKEVLILAKDSSSYAHQARATMAIAYLKKGEKKKAVEMFDLAVGSLADPIATAANLNFEVVESFLARNFEVDRCRQYVEKALKLAREKKEEKPIQFLQKLLQSFEVTMH